MPKPDFIELSTAERVSILHEDRSVLAIDKPRSWMLAPSCWRNTCRNLQNELASGIRAGDFWARSRNLRYLRFVHRLDADTTGVLLLGKSPGAVRTFGALFASRRMEKLYWAVVHGVPKQEKWCCRLKLAPDPAQTGRMMVDVRKGKEAETHFRTIGTDGVTTLVEARPLTGRTHQIRVHLAETGHPVVGDALYGLPGGQSNPVLALRAVALAYVDPFTRRWVRIVAPTDEFLRGFVALRRAAQSRSLSHE